MTTGLLPNDQAFAGISPGARIFRDDVCAFLSAELTPEVRSRYRDESAYQGWDMDFRREFRRRLGARGYLAASWPVEYGGGGRDAVHQLMYAEEVEYHDAPALEPATTYVPHVLMRYGTDEQKSTYLPMLRAGEIGVFLGYSEPEAGSDLAGLATVAVPEGDGYVLTGQKSYSSWADVADYGLVAARAPGSARHSGITLFWVDMTSPGIALSTHRTIAGSEHPSVYLDHVRVPAANVIGAAGEGWRCLMGAIDFERMTLGAPGLLARQLEALLAVGSPASGPAADRLVSAAVEIEAARLLAYEAANRSATGEAVAPATSALAILMKREAARYADGVGMELIGPLGQLHPSNRFAPAGGAIEQAYREHLYFHFAAGGFDIARNVLAVRGLGLPR